MSEQLEEIQAEIDLEIEARIQKFIGKPCNYLMAMMLQLSINRYLDSLGGITSNSQAVIDKDETDYSLKKIGYIVTVFLPFETETVELNLTYTANL
ncbi:MAG: hypothetical protein HC907_35140 [Richelia sp. SM1_7_0]|nr:hypothetical protein [Richelia sp. SM1_7_0]